MVVTCFLTLLPMSFGFLFSNRQRSESHGFHFFSFECTHLEVDDAAVPHVECPEHEVRVLRDICRIRKYFFKKSVQYPTFCIESDNLWMTFNLLLSLNEVSTQSALERFLYV